jgi:hypothetical protein
VSERARPGYVRLRKEGPNDGLTPIVDEILPGSVTIVELGLDHFYWHPEMPLRTVALAQAVIQWVERHHDRNRSGHPVPLPPHGSERRARTAGTRASSVTPQSTKNVSW